MIVELSPGLASWSYGDTTLTGGMRHDLDPDAEFGAAVAAAVAAGALVLIDGDLDKAAVESDKESLRKLAAADKARAPLYEERDRELAEAARDAAFDSEDESEVPRAERVEVATADKLAEWDARMAEAAQAAVEEMI